LAKIVALIPCAGQGKRLGAGVSKPYLEVNGRPLLAFTLAAFQKHPLVDALVLVAEAEAIEQCWLEVVKKYDFTKVSAIVAGGRERQESVLNGLRSLSKDTKWVIVHDGARPLISEQMITNSLETAKAKGSAVVAVRAKDTIKEVSEDLIVAHTLPRRSLWQAQTPQIFEYSHLLKAYEMAEEKQWVATDDASLIEKLGEKVYIVEGDYSNIKITTPEDLIYFKAMIKVAEVK